MPLMSVLHISAAAGFASPCARTLPTLLAQDRNTIAYSVSRGRKILRLSGALRKLLPPSAAGSRLLPTLCATDYKSPYSAEGYQRQAAKRSKPLRDTAKHTLGIRLIPDFCEWWMGWPIGSTASLRSEMDGSQHRPPLRGDCLEVRK
jgi:hypothetical protein